MKQKIHLSLTKVRLSQTEKLLIAILLLCFVGGAVFYTGLKDPFMGDDNSQIVLNQPVHSLSNIKLFFEGGTFYDGQPNSPLSGAYYRPLMTAAFSLLYTLFGPHPYYFHFFQTALYIGSSILLFLFLKRFFKPALSLVVAIVFLVHPLNSQVALALPSMQDVLFFFFGILALYLLFSLESIKSLGFVVVCLFLSLLAKETAILFIAMSLLYLYFWDKRRLRWLTGGMLLPIVFYLVLKINAVGLFTNSANAPIEKLSLFHRLLTSPSIAEFYIGKFIFPYKLASAYYWVYPTLSFTHFVLPLVIDLAVLGAIVYGGLLLKQRTPKMFTTYSFFAIWAILGVGMLLQILPLDMTASETWFYFPMVGVLGMLAVIASNVASPARLHIDRRVLLILMVLLLALLGVRTAARGTDWRNQSTLAIRDVAASPQDYVADSKVAIDYYDQAKYQQAKDYALKSVNLFPTATNYNVLGTIFIALNDYTDAAKAYDQGLHYQRDVALYDSIASLTSIINVYGSPEADKQFLLKTLKTYPQDANLWFNLTVLDYREGGLPNAKFAIKQAYHFAPTNSAIAIDYFRLWTGKSLYYTWNSDPVPY